MASHTLSPSLWVSVRDLIYDLTEYSVWRSGTELQPDDLQAERDLVKDAVLMNPDAFSSDLDIQLMMHMYSGR